jgi:hypothetical protein
MRLLLVLAACLPCSAFAFPIRIDAIGFSTIVAVTGEAPGPRTSSSSFWSDPYYSHALTDGQARTFSIANTNDRIGVDTYASFTGSYSTIADREDYFALRLTFSGEAYAHVFDTAPVGTHALSYSQSYGTFAWFNLDAPAQYLGSLRLLGGHTYGDILQPGSYSAAYDALSIRAEAESSTPGYSEYSRVSRTGTLQFAAVPVPEPGVLLLLSGGVAGVAMMRLRRRTTLRH